MHTVITSSIGMNLLGFEYNHGGIFESVGTRGISHLMEHLMCKTSDDLREYLKSLGIEHNAYTSDNKVVFWWTGLNTSLAEVSQLLYDRITLQPILWTKEQFENEKKTVLQEYGDTFNDQFEGYYYNTFRKYYNYTGAIGYKEDIENFTYEDSLQFAESFRAPSLICEVGDSFISPREFSYKEYPTTKLKFSDYTSSILLEEVPKEGKTIVGLLGLPCDSKNAAKLNLLMTCLTGGLESPFYQEIREKRGLSYFSLGWSEKLGNVVIPFFASATTNDKASELKNVYEQLISNTPENILTESYFNACHKNLMIKKKISEILPHSGAKTTVLGSMNPFETMESFTYTEALTLLKECINPITMTHISY